MRLKPFLGLGAAHVVVAVVEPLCTLRKSRCGSVAKNDGGRVGVMAARLSLLLQQTNGYQPRARRKEIQKGRVAERARARQPIYSRRAQRAEHNARFMCHVFLCFHVHCAFVLYRAVFKHFVAFEKRRRNVRGRGMEVEGGNWLSRSIGNFGSRCDLDFSKFGWEKLLVLSIRMSVIDIVIFEIPRMNIR